NGTFVEPWGERSQRGYGIEILRKFFEEVAFVEFGGPAGERGQRLNRMRGVTCNDGAAGRNTGGGGEGREAVLPRPPARLPGRVGKGWAGGVVLRVPGKPEVDVLYAKRV